MEKKKILIICTRNSSRSQMAEGIINVIYNDKFEAYSAGSNPSIVNPYAIKAMSEIGIDISNHRSKSISEFYGTEFDLIVTVCDNAKKFCPTFAGAKKMIHNAFIDPSEAIGSEKEILNVFKTVRDQIHEWIKEFLLKNF